MDYKEKYEKAFDEARVIHKCGNAQVKQIIEHIFPELRESEDEIPQKLHNLLCAEVTYEQFEKHNLTVDSALDWLEKQKPKWSEEDNELLNAAIGLIVDSYHPNDVISTISRHSVRKIVDWLKSLKDRVMIRKYLVRQFEKVFREFKKEYPDWEKRFPNDLHYRLMSWYDDWQHYFDIDGYSEKARDFASYVWDKYVDPPEPQGGDKRVSRNEVCRWLAENLERYDPSIGWDKEEFVENFRKFTEYL